MELTTARNIKDRKNRHNVCRTLTKLSELLPHQDMTMGVIVYCGIDEYEQEIVSIIIPKIQLDIFYYNCGNKFITHIAEKYTNEHKGNIVFADGNKCIIYEFKYGKFIIKKQFDALLQKRQKKGGQSAIRIARLAEETRHMYVIKIIDYLNRLDRDCKTLLFGSNEITTMIVDGKTLLCPVIYGGFLEFDTDTIKNARKWIDYLDTKNDNISEYDDKYKIIIECLDMPEKVDRLDFSPEKIHEMEFCLTHDETIINRIPFPRIGTDYYERLRIFEYIGVKYFNYVYDDDDIMDYEL